MECSLLFGWCCLMHQPATLVGNCDIGKLGGVGMRGGCEAVAGCDLWCRRSWFQCWQIKLSRHIVNQLAKRNRVHFHSGPDIVNSWCPSWLPSWMHDIDIIIMHNMHALALMCLFTPPYNRSSQKWRQQFFSVCTWGSGSVVGVQIGGKRYADLAGKDIARERSSSKRYGGNIYF